MTTTLKNTVEGMKRMAVRLMPLTYPRATLKVEHDILILKQRTLLIDGYTVLVCYSEADYGEYVLNSLQIQSVYSPYLPFTFICKVGKMFLGESKLSFIEFYRGDKKVYCWTTRTLDGKTLGPIDASKPGSFEGFEFSVLDSGSLNLL